ncbi:polysaccharide biosynthesis tyrosine autokinase [Clavibacter phaseoli]|uniref:polysaccharide biosynthesis tyrosine autokinase n=1 Tax=Clavibacter phaseoli TaxID=1734031 RepID=UPI0021753B85|nr:polysaccharide biosynthesis tyrosine autokinase [Clavibacter phaseoli]
MTLHEFTALLRRYWYVVVAATLAGGVVAFGLSQLATPVFTAQSRLYFSLSSGSSASDLNQGATYTQSQMLSFGELAESPAVLEPVITRLGLDLTPQQLARAVTVTTPQNTVVMEISVTEPSPAQAADIANAVATSLRDTAEAYAPTGAEGSPTVSVRVIQEAPEPEFQSAPNGRTNTLAGLLLGLLAGLLGLALVRLLDTRVRSAETVAHLTTAPLLGSLERERGVTGLAMAVRPLSTAAEGFRQLKANLRFVLLGERASSFVVTSSIPGEGKSTVAANLAISLSEGGRRVLLVDADLRRPVIAQYLGLEGDAGLTTVLVGQALMEDVVQPWGEGSLEVLTSGEIPPNPSELLASGRMEDLVAQARATYDVIVLDTAPLIAVADAAFVARMTDGAIVVADQTRVHRGQLTEALDAVEKSGGSVLGVVLNKVRPTKDKRAYYRAETEKASRAARPAVAPARAQGSSTAPERESASPS